MAEITVTKQPRFTGKDVALVGSIAAATLAVVIAVVLAASNVFDPTKTTTVTPAGRTGSVETSDLATAKFAVVALVLIGALVMLAGFLVALTEVATPLTTAVVPEEPEPDVVPKGAGAATGISAVLVGVGEVAKGLGSALKGLTAAGVLILMGGLLVIMGGAVAWQTVPDTDRNPTIQVGDTTPVTGDTTTTTSTPGASTTDVPPDTAGD